jgi:hypothetical protein
MNDEIKLVYDTTYENFYGNYELANSMLAYKTPNEEFHICRYCGNSDIDKFKSKAHLIPEFTGNKDIFCHNECDDCNGKFGIYETHLNAFSGIKNTFLPIKGKKGYPKFKDTKRQYTAQVREGNTVLLRSENDSNYMKIENGFVNIKATTQSFIPLYVYKALVKFGLSLLKIEDLEKFRTAIEWIKNPESQEKNIIPLLLIHNESRPPLAKPFSLLFKRKTNLNSPEFIFIFSYGFHRLQIFLPFNETDKELNLGDVRLPLNFEFVTQSQRDKNKWSFGHFDMDYLEKVKLTDDFKVKLNPSKN